MPEATPTLPEEKPQEVPVQEAKPSPDKVPDAVPDEAVPDKVLEAAPVEPPKPELRPDDTQPQVVEPIDPPKPEPRPDIPTPDAVAPDIAKPAEPPFQPDPRSADVPDPSGVLPTEEAACRRRLTELGVAFTEHKAESDPEGCSIPYPLTVKSLGGNIGLQPEAEMNCAMAEATARFAKDVISPHAQKIFRQKLKSVAHASAYVCRPRAGTRTLSEHAFGNALDIASFTLADGTSVAVELDPPEKDGKFVDTVRRSACGPFKTVLGPGDPDHSGHLHLDLAPRRNGGIVCE
ncbi:MAG: extensin family protein [Hyphomicrobiales bacterium]|nr:extensin family protein [Hyphomicrobiales bacterium]